MAIDPPPFARRRQDGPKIVHHLSASSQTLDPTGRHLSVAEGWRRDPVGGSMSRRRGRRRAAIASEGAEGGKAEDAWEGSARLRTEVR